MKVLRLAVQCPECERSPAIDIPEEERDRARSEPPGRLKMHYICRRCGLRFAIYAAAFQYASAIAVRKFVDTERAAS